MSMFNPKNKKNKMKKMKPEELGSLYKKQLDAAKEQFGQMEFMSESEDGAVSVVVTGQREIKNLSLAPELISGPIDHAEALITAVVNDALRIVRAANIQLTDELMKNFKEQIAL